MFSLPARRRRRRRLAVPIVVPMAVLAALPAILALAAWATAVPAGEGTHGRAAMAAQTGADSSGSAVLPTPRLTPLDRWFGESRSISVDGHVIYYGVGRSIAVAIYDEDAPNRIRFDRRSAPLPLTAPDAPLAPITDLAFGQPGIWAVTGQAEDGVAFFDFRGPMLFEQDLQLVGRILLDGGEAPLAITAIGQEAIVTVGDPDGVRQGGIVMLRADAAGAPHVIGRWRDPLGTRGLFATTDVLWDIETDEVLVGGKGGGQALVRLALQRSTDGTATFDVTGRHAEAVPNVRYVAADEGDRCRVYGIESDDDTRPSFGGLWVFDTCASTTAGGGIRVLGQVRPPESMRLSLSGVSGGYFGLLNIVTVADVRGGVWSIRTTDPEEMSWPHEPLVPPLTTPSACRTAVFAYSDVIFSAGCGLRAVETRLDDSDRPMPRIVRTASLPHVPVFDRPYADQSGTARVVAAGGRLYYGVADTLSVIDPRAPLAPGVTGQARVASDGLAKGIQTADLAVAADVAWMTPTEGPVTAVDVRDPVQPQVIGSIEGLNATVLAAGSGLLAAVADDGSAAPLKLFDVTDPAAPRPVAQIAIRVPPSGDLAIDDGRLFVAAGMAEGLRVIDVRDPAHPKVLGTDDSEAARRSDVLAVADDVLVTIGDRELTVYGLDRFPDGKLVRLAGLTLRLPDMDSLFRPHLGLTRIGGRRIAVVVTDDQIVAVDVTEPSMPIVGEPYRLMAPAQTMAVEGDRAYVWGRGYGADMTVFEVSALAIVRRLQLPLLLNGGKER